MADSWQQIDDDGVLMDWTSADTIRLCDLWHPLEAIRRAINERYYAQPKGIWENPVAEQPRLKDVYSACLALHNAITNMLVRSNFYIIDYTQGNPNFNNLSSLPFINSVSEALAFIGDSTRVVPNRLYDISSWLIQSYKFINMCRWFRPSAIMPSQYKTKYGTSYCDPDYTRYNTPQEAWPYAVSNYASAEWTSPGRFPGMVVGSDYISGGGFQANIQITSANAFRISTAYHVSSIASVDLYGIPQRYYGTEGGYLDDVYPYENKLNLIKSYSEQSLKDFNTNNTGKLLEDQTPITPHAWASFEPPYSNLSNYWSCEPFRGGGNVVVKFDGPNGFKFKDW